MKKKQYELMKEALVYGISNVGLAAEELPRKAEAEFSFLVSAEDRDPRWLRQQLDLLDATIATISLPVLPTVSKFHRRNLSEVTFSYSNPQILKLFNECGRLEEYCRSIRAAFKGGLIARRPKRQRHQLPDPELPPNHPKNRYKPLTVQFKSDIDPTLAERFNALREAKGLKKRDMVEEAIRKYLDDNEPQ